ncbi:carboxypeptidase-like regulatory domain-containing protein [Deinococcus cellulosilyticus]|uniref:Carboxypeptidase regulatory-like domain-containing protein n=1 Tax=Deinococcus cellulosilyticus (strain DSM 18568 / NBRC 106333 / KACC 11606 / 5516J-15) TaxID=1223518 RepID=A0A511N662_DEIC1|nr:carboxypeptidase-like regulatory domain-containing protein [Deinococcus cellulosilyticus]GEM48359.1 hypothetical protein DC3_39940 [Deinococcus cellulosilyticus NBRC 106333 = KACC 11606]
MKTLNTIRSTSLLLLTLLVGCNSAASNTPTDPTPENGVLQGKVLKANGDPVVGAQIFIQPALFSGFVKARTDSSGKYRSPQLSSAAAPYEADAFYEVDYHGRHYCVRMSGETPEDEDVFNPTHGATRNFRWKMTGHMASQHGEVWGGSLQFTNETATPIPWGSSIKLRLEPDGPLIDGSQGTMLERTVKLEQNNFWRDIPVGRYRVTAQLQEEDGSWTPIRLRVWRVDDEPQNEATLLFDGFNSCGHTGSFGFTTVIFSR